MWSLQLGEARYMMAALGSYCGGTLLDLVLTLRKVMLDPCVVPFRVLIREPQLVCLLIQGLLERKRSMGRYVSSLSFVLILKHEARSEGPAEIIRHVLFGYFSQKRGLLVQMEDPQLTSIQSSGGDAYWEITINSYMEEYRPVEGIMIAHLGHSVVTLIQIWRFGNEPYKKLGWKKLGLLKRLPLMFQACLWTVSSHQQTCGPDLSAKLVNSLMMEEKRVPQALQLIRQRWQL